MWWRAGRSKVSLSHAGTRTLWHAASEKIARVDGGRLRLWQDLQVKLVEMIGESSEGMSSAVLSHFMEMVNRRCEAEEGREQLALPLPLPTPLPPASTPVMYSYRLLSPPNASSFSCSPPVSHRWLLPLLSPALPPLISRFAHSQPLRISFLMACYLPTSLYHRCELLLLPTPLPNSSVIVCFLPPADLISH